MLYFILRSFDQKHDSLVANQLSQSRLIDRRRSFVLLAVT